MKLLRAADPSERARTFALTGDIGEGQVRELRAGLVDAVNDAAMDVLVDVRGVTAFDDSALGAFSTARTRAKFLRHRLAVLDGEDGVVLASLRRTGMVLRFPVYPDAAVATVRLAADRDARSRLNLQRDRAKG